MHIRGPCPKAKKENGCRSFLASAENLGINRKFGMNIADWLKINLSENYSFEIVFLATVQYPHLSGSNLSGSGQYSGSR